MNKKWLRNLYTAALAGISLTTAAAAAGEFHQQLAELINSQDTSAYFGEMVLSPGSLELTVDGKSRPLDAAPEVRDEHLMLPVRAVAEASGSTVTYDTASHAAVIVNDRGDEIRCPIGETSITVNDKSYAMETAAYIKNGRTYLPAQALADACSMEVQWDAETNTVTISAPYQTARLVVMTEEGQTLDTAALDASTVLSDGSGLWILQYDTPAEAKAALQALNEQGIAAEPDSYIPPVTPAVSSDTAAVS